MRFHIGGLVRLDRTIGPFPAGAVGTVLATPREDGAYRVRVGESELATTGVHLRMAESR